MTTGVVTYAHGQIDQARTELGCYSCVSTFNTERKSWRVLRAVVLDCQVHERGGIGEQRDAVCMGDICGLLSILPFRADALRSLNRVYRQGNHDVVVTEGDEEAVIVR